MPVGFGRGGSGGGGGGLHYRRPVDFFADAAARSTYFTTTDATAFEAFVADEFLAIVIGTLAIPTDFQTYGGAAGTYDDTLWVSRADAVQGFPGDTGAQARFLVFAHINTATAPTVAPTGGEFVRSTGVQTVPAGYTIAAVTPATGETTYRASAVVNPAVDGDTVTLTWSIPAELPAYLAARLAETAQAAAETAQTAAETAQAASATSAAQAAVSAGQAVDIPTGSPRGDLIATTPTLSTTSVANGTSRAFGTGELWTVDGGAPADFAAGLPANNERLYTPDIHPPGTNGIWAVVEVDGVEIDETIIPWGGPAYTPSTGQSAVYVAAILTGTAARHVQVRWVPRVGATASYLEVYGAGTVLPADTVVKIYLAVVRGEKGDKGDAGTGPGTSTPTNLSIVNRGADTLDVASDTGTDATLPAATTAAAGLMTGTDKTALDAATYSGETLFGAVDPVAADGNNKDTWINTADGTIWKKAAGAWTEEYTFPSGTTPVGDHTRRAAIAAGAALTEAEVTAGTSSMTQVVTAPALVDWPSGTLRTLYLGVPEAEDAITDIQQGGLSLFIGYEHYEDVDGNKTIVSGHQWVRTTTAVDGEINAGAMLTIVQ